MAKYQQYEEYKDSGVEWLGEMPRHWIITKTSRFFKIAMGQTILKEDLVDDGRLPVFSATEGNHYLGRINYANVNLEKGDLVIPARGNSIGFVKIVEEPSTTTQTTIYCKQLFKEKLISKYVYYYFFGSKRYLFRFTQTAIPQITTEEVGNNTLIVPPVLEQHDIINFLDYQVIQIDTLIEKQQTLIQLLKEKRQAVISHAVTKGLNPDALMKDSGVEWLGEVPEHWDIVKLKWKASTTSGGTPTTSKYEDYYEDGDIPWIRTTDLNNDKLNETPIMITPKAVRDSACSLLPKDSVLIAMYGGAGSIGKHSLLNFESTINQAVCGVLPSEAFVPDYLHRFYEFYRPFWMIGAAGTRKDPNIGQDNIKEARVPIPPLSEQHQIADYLDKMQSHFDALTESAEKGIQLMQERRTALISAAVTGKIDVRGWRAAE